MYCVYLTVYFGNKLPKRYIGSSSVERVKSGYNGSIKSKKYKSIYLKEQIENKQLFKTRILSMHNNLEDAILEELRLHMKYNVVKSPNYMNMSYAQPNGFFGRDISGKNHPFYNKSHTLETKQKISQTLKSKFKSKELSSPFSKIDSSGENNGFYGKTHSEESKQKMRKPKSYVPMFECPHCHKMYDAGNLKQHLKRVNYEK